MDSDPIDGDLAKFLRKALEIQLSDSNSSLSEEDLARIAQNAGLSEEDWKRVCKRFNEHLQKGRNFHRFDNHIDAISELEQAVSLAPYQADVLIDCGNAHLAHWRKTRSKSSHRRAGELARKALKIDPTNAEAAKLLSETKAKPPAGRGLARKSLIATGVGALAAAAAVAAWLGISKPTNEREPITEQLPPAAETFLPPAQQRSPAEAALEFFRKYHIFAKDFPVVFTNSLEMNFVSVPIFEGNNQVSSLLVCVNETRVQDYRPFADELNVDDTWKNPGYESTDAHPVTFIDWHEAKAYCEWLTLKEREAGLIGPNDRYRLPTDHEWSCAIGIGTLEPPRLPPKFKHNALRDVYPWGVDWPPATVLGNYRGPEDEERINAPFLPDAYLKAAPTGSFPLTHWGIEDLGGNVWEWSETHWNVDMIDEKSTRGGSWNTQNGNHILSAGRRWIKSHDRKDFLGFRVVLDRGK
ncbi:MAG: hypothetical protein CMO55_11220 [Verrucomicrobiales bacterium]|nr:hypothetical protein [Verrucomicrobiales bacterium]